MACSTQHTPLGRRAKTCVNCMLPSGRAFEALLLAGLSWVSRLQQWQPDPLHQAWSLIADTERWFVSVVLTLRTPSVLTVYYHRR